MVKPELEHFVARFVLTVCKHLSFRIGFAALMAITSLRSQRALRWTIRAQHFRSRATFTNNPMRALSRITPVPPAETSGSPIPFVGSDTVTTAMFMVA